MVFSSFSMGPLETPDPRRNPRSLGEFLRTLEMPPAEILDVGNGLYHIRLADGEQYRWQEPPEITTPLYAPSEPYITMRNGASVGGWDVAQEWVMPNIQQFGTIASDGSVTIHTDGLADNASLMARDKKKKAQRAAETPKDPPVDS